MAEILRINATDKYYPKTLALRQKILRDPIGMTYGPVELEFDEQVDYFIYVVDGEVFGCVGLVKEGEKLGRLMQMAVDDKLQGQGVGRQVVTAAEDYARGAGFGEMMLHARYEVRKFYERLGYYEYGAEYEKIGIRHINMKKLL